MTLMKDIVFVSVTFYAILNQISSLGWMRDLLLFVLMFVSCKKDGGPKEGRRRRIKRTFEAINESDSLVDKRVYDIPNDCFLSS